jgi:hypothetical protein
VTGRQQNDIARLDSSLVALSAAVSDADLRRDRDAAGASVGDVERVPRFEDVLRFHPSHAMLRLAEQWSPCAFVWIQTLAP